MGFGDGVGYLVCIANEESGNLLAVAHPVPEDLPGHRACTEAEASDVSDTPMTTFCGEQ
jgi:hypothetical protein